MSPSDESFYFTLDSHPGLLLLCKQVYDASEENITMVVDMLKIDTREVIFANHKLSFNEAEIKECKVYGIC